MTRCSVPSTLTRAGSSSPSRAVRHRGCRGGRGARELFAPPLDDPDELWVHELIGRRGRGRQRPGARNRRRRRGQSGQRPAGPRGGALIPLRFVVSERARGAGHRRDSRRPARPGLTPATVRCAQLRIDVFTLFPRCHRHYADASILGAARDRGQLDLRTHDVRDAAQDPAPVGGRRPVRRRSGHGARTRTRVRGGRGGRRLRPRACPGR